LEHRGKFWRAPDFVFDDVRGDSGRQRERESHNRVMGWPNLADRVSQQRTGSATLET
jgi:hypothetical protein